MISYLTFALQFQIHKRNNINEVDIFYYHDDDYETYFDYYRKEGYFVTPQSNVFQRLFSKIPILSERQFGTFSILGPIFAGQAGVLFAGIFGLVAFSGKNLREKP